MTYIGIVHDGVVVLPPDAELPEGLEVAIQPLTAYGSRVEIPDDWRSELRNGVPVFPPTASARISDLDLVNKLRDEA